MNEWTIFINFSIGVAGLVMSVLGLVQNIVLSHALREGVSRRYCIYIFSVMIAYSITIILSYVSEGFAHAVGMRWGIFLSSLFASVLMLVLNAFILSLSGEKWWKSRLFWCTAILWCLYAAMLLSTWFSPAIYSISDEGVYFRGPYYTLLLIPPVLIMLLNLAGLCLRRKKLTPRQQLAMLLFLLFPLLGMLLQIFYYGVLGTALGTTIGAATMSLFILLDQVDNFTRQKEETARKEFEILILQMRPHFIYNTLTSIYYITESNPEKGLKVIRDFTTYLRKAFNSVNRREPIPFKEELEHTRAYLSVEQARFEDRLEVSFDTPHTSFFLPPLTLQPIVENAVKHGMDSETECLSISIRTSAVPGGSEIIVENDGTDYDPASNAENGVGLDNISIRIQKTCGGSLKISQREGGGKVVKVYIPDNEEDRLLGSSRPCPNAWLKDPDEEGKGPNT